MVVIPYALTYKTTLRGQVPKAVRCDQCAFEYVYVLEMTVAGESTSYLFLDNEGAKQRSGEQAQAVLEQDLQRGCEVVPCPSCGNVQAHMLPRARELHRRWMHYAGLIALAGAGILTLPAMIYTLIDSTTDGISAATAAVWAGVALTACAGIGMLVHRSISAGKLDPNQTPLEIRKKQGQELAVSLTEYLKIIGAPEPAPKDGPVDDRITEM